LPRGSLSQILTGLDQISGTIKPGNKRKTTKNKTGRTEKAGKNSVCMLALLPSPKLHRTTIIGTVLTSHLKYAVSKAVLYVSLSVTESRLAQMLNFPRMLLKAKHRWKSGMVANPWISRYFFLKFSCIFFLTIT